MKKIVILILFFLMLSHSSLTYSYASKALIIWFNTLVPTLLPMLIISNLILITQAWKLLIPIVHPIFRFLFCTSPSGSFSILLGVLCGYPVGAKIVSDLYTKKELSYSEARRVLTFATFPSPMFLNGYILNQFPIKFPILIAIYGSSICIGIFHSIKIRFHSTEKIHFTSSDLKNTPPLSFKEVQQILLSSSEILLFAGLYMMLATILAGFLEHYLTFLSQPLLFLLTGLLEMTTGISYLLNSSLSLYTTSFLIVFLCCFGGLSIALQTSTVLPKEKLHTNWFLHYIIWKFIHAIVAICILQITTFIRLI